MDCGGKCIKVLLFIFNFIFVVCGLALIVIGALVLTTFKATLAIYGSAFPNAPIAIIVAGCLVFVIAFCGCCGAIIENKVLLIIFSIALIVILIIQIALSITAYVYRGKIDTIIGEELNKAVNAKKNQMNGTMLIDVVQQQFTCCGVNGTMDYGVLIPPSCCPKGTNVTCLPTTAYQQGCKTSVTNTLKRQIGILAGISLLICLVEIIGVILAIFLVKSISDSYESV